MFALRGLSLVVASGGYTSFVAWVSRCSGFSYCGAQALGTQASVVAARGLNSSLVLECRLGSCGAWA